MHLDNIKSVTLYKNVLAHYKGKEDMFNIKKYIEIQLFSGKVWKLDVDKKTDISDNNNIEILSKGKGKQLFYNVYS